MNSKTPEKSKIEIIPPIYDFSFKALFKRGNLRIVKGFLQSFLSISDDEFDHIEFVDTELTRTEEDDKLSIVDLLLHTKNGNVIHIEMQIANMEDFRKRAIYYNSGLLYTQLKKGEDYAKLKKTISILIIDFEMFESPTYMRTFRLKCSDDELFTDLIEYHVLEIPKVPEDFDGSKRCEWAKFFASKEEEEFNLCAEKNSDIKEAVVVLKELTEDERNRMIAEREEKMRRDHVARIEFGAKKGFQLGHKQGVEQGVEEGIEKGIEKGKIESQIEIAKNMLKNDLSIEVIGSYTSLPEETILAIQSDLK